MTRSHSRSRHSAEFVVSSSAFVLFCDASRINLSLPQALCSPLVEKLGLEYSKTDSADITQLRTLAVEGAATVGDAA
jgi:hypothetical protein